MIVMRDKRAIIIKDSRLQKIRNNLRDILIEAYHVQWKEIHNKWRSYFFNSGGSRRDIDDLSPIELKEFRRLQEKESQLSKALDRSILVCIACGKGHRDMVYNKPYKAWYCTECYGMERTYARELQRKRAKSKSKPKGHEEKAIESHSKTFL